MGALVDEVLSSNDARHGQARIAEVLSGKKSVSWVYQYYCLIELDYLQQS
jgi:hypothetical protein